jgi:hypothetical protein
MAMESYLSAKDKARVEIDTMLEAAGWAVQDARDVNPAAARGVAVREFVLEPPHGRVNYLVTEVERQLSIVPALTAAIDRAHERSATLRGLILDQAFSGKLVSEKLGLDADGRGVLGGVAGPLTREPPLDNPLCGPPVDGVGGHLDLEHPVRDVLADGRTAQAGAPGGPLQRPELPPALVDGDDAGLGFELGLDGGVFVLAGDLAHPAASMVAYDEDEELRVVSARFCVHPEVRAGLRRGERAQAPADA